MKNYRQPHDIFGESRIALLFRRNPLLKLLAINGVIGVGISILIVVGLLAGDVGHLRSLISKTHDPIVPLLLLAGGMIITMTSVVMGTAIMMLQDPARDGRDGGRGPRLPVLSNKEPALVPVRARNGRPSRTRY